MFEIHWLLVFQLVSSTHSFHLQCPDISQRLLRASGYCTSRLRSKYTCLYDTNMLSYFEQCNRNPDFVTPGEKYVISGNLRNVDCSSDRYQPFRLWSNVSGECLNKKALCEGEGQVIFNNGSLTVERTCRCDYTRGYKFIKRPKQNCSCNPSEEDCSCYVSECNNGSELSPDYECVEDKMQTDSKCPIIEIESGGSWQRQNIKSYTDKQEKPRIILIAVSTMCVLFLVYTVIVSVFWEKIPKIDCKQGISRDVENLGKVSASMYGDRNLTRTTESSTRVVQPTTDETAQLRLNDTVLERTTLQHEDIVKLKDAKIAELQQLLDQRDKEIKIKDTEISSKNIELTKREKKMKEKDIEIQTKEYEVKEKINDIRTFESERRQLHNQIQELKGNIRVFCRLRPLLNHEKRGNNCKIDHISFPGLNKIEVVTTRNAILNEKNKTTKFSFDKVFKHNATQDQVFREISQLVQSALDGYNVCIFAYGQTGSGKTYTMEGTSIRDDTDVNRGMVPRSVLQIFDTIKKLKIEGWTYTVDASCLEIYGKEIKDLLCNKKGDQKPEIQDVKNETRVTNITIKRVATKEDVYMLLQKASNNRTVAATKSNQSSSRGHSVFTLKITAENSITDDTSKSTLYLVDLAGSERTKTSGVEGQHMKEAVAINKSLSTLGRVIRAIKDKEKVIPFRDSNLTYLLQHSMGGNSKTLMLVNISPQEDCVEETLNSLRFAQEANQCKIGVAQKNQ